MSKRMRVAKGKNEGRTRARERLWRALGEWAGNSAQDDSFIPPKCLVQLSGRRLPPATLPVFLSLLTMFIFILYTRLAGGRGGVEAGEGTSLGLGRPCREGKAGTRRERREEEKEETDGRKREVGRKRTRKEADTWKQ